MTLAQISLISSAKKFCQHRVTTYGVAVTHQSSPGFNSVFVMDVRWRVNRQQVLSHGVLCVLIWSAGIMVVQARDSAAVRQLRESRNCVECDLQNAALQSAYLQAANLTQANLAGADLRGADLRGALLRQANLRNADLRETNLDGANLEGANLAGARLNNTYFGNDIDRARLDQPWKIVWRLVNEPHAVADEIADFPEELVTISGANLSHSNLQSFSFVGSVLEGNLENSDFSSTDLSGANFSELNVQNSSFFAAILNDTNFANARLQNADFGQVSLAIGANFSSAQLHDTNFSQANVQEADFTDAFLIRANLATANLTRATLTRTDFTEADLVRADLSDAILIDTLFPSAQMQGVTFRNSAAQNLDFSNSNLQDVDFRALESISANFEGANLCGAVMWDESRYDC